MLTSPQTVTIDGVAHSLVRVNQDNGGSVFRKKVAGLELQLTLRNSTVGKAGPGLQVRHNVELRRTTWDANNNPIISTNYIVMQSLDSADPSVSAKDGAGLWAWCTTNKDAIAIGEP